MTYVCIFNPETREILGEESYDEETQGPELQLRREMYATECMARAYPWQPYSGPEPFAFPVEEEEPQDA